MTTADHQVWEWHGNHVCIIHRLPRNLNVPTYSNHYDSAVCHFFNTLHSAEIQEWEKTVQEHLPFKEVEFEYDGANSKAIHVAQRRWDELNKEMQVKAPHYHMRNFRMDTTSHLHDLTTNHDTMHTAADLYDPPNQSP